MRTRSHRQHGHAAAHPRLSGLRRRSLATALFKGMIERLREYVPTLSNLPPLKLTETPSYRHRCLCIEGAVSFEHVRDNIEWLPRVGMNGYFIQFREGHTFFDRWYSHENNPTMPGRPIGQVTRDRTSRAMPRASSRRSNWWRFAREPISPR